MIRHALFFRCLKLCTSSWDLFHQVQMESLIAWISKVPSNSLSSTHGPVTDELTSQYCFVQPAMRSLLHSLSILTVYSHSADDVRSTHQTPNDLSCRRHGDQPRPQPVPAAVDLRSARHQTGRLFWPLSGVVSSSVTSPGDISPQRAGGGRGSDKWETIADSGRWWILSGSDSASAAISDED